ncbi:type 2A phosphatase-associated protein 42 [Bimuria novae-zelandiae CBS 107.79]|uniref:Type 2A phosphatase-associated protein 42 n=1 Tax=Bimuria novae-zelandiae CBS 107.79 TaxID=1447943 RepID=A0A6A5UJ41_9PLEO|nr:type 2A phosphatase-associated protein 42 [Bimuria novae-zelandiae CBS 107.79]
MSDDEPKSIRALFLTAERLRNNLDNFPDSNSPTYQENLANAIATYESCLALSEQVSLFSPNESLDDVSSSDIQYMSISYHLAELTQKLRTTDISSRKANLLRARGFYERFVKLLDSYDVLRTPDAKLWETYLSDKAHFSVASTRDAAARRDAKIARFREEKELKQKLAFLQQNPRLAEQDEQLVRELRLTSLAFMVHHTFASLESLAQELHILSLAPPALPQGSEVAPPDAREDARGRDAYSERLDSNVGGLRYNGPILSSDGKPMRPFTLLDKRQRLQQGVFRPDHSLPTMTIDEYLDEERRRGGIIEGGGEQSGIRPEVDEDDLRAADEETMKARAWDEFKEDNPKGSGNTINRG